MAADDRRGRVTPRRGPRRSVTWCFTGFWHPVQFSRSGGAAPCGFRPPRTSRPDQSGFRGTAVSLTCVGRGSRSWHCRSQASVPGPWAVSRREGGTGLTLEPRPLGGTTSVRGGSSCCQVTVSGRGLHGPVSPLVTPRRRGAASCDATKEEGTHPRRIAPTGGCSGRPALTTGRQDAAPEVTGGNGSPPAHR